MTPSTRKRLGWSLLGLSALAFLAARIFFSHARVTGSGSDGNVSWADVEVTNDLGWGFFIPVLAGGATGLICLVWPARKPPKLGGK